MKRATRLLCLLCQSYMVSTVAASLPAEAITENTLSTCSALKISGYEDTSYNYLLRNNIFVSGVRDRLNDTTENGLTLQQAAMIFSVTPKLGLGGYLNMMMGKDANYIAPLGMNPDFTSGSNSSYAIPEAYLQYAYSSYILFLGEMNTIIGYENYDYGLDPNFSRSILDGYAQPGAHVGVRIADQLNPEWLLQFGLGNGGNTVRQPAHMNGIEWAVQYTLADLFNVMVDGYFWQQHLYHEFTSGPMTNVYVFDVYGDLKATNKISFAMNYDYGYENNTLLPTELLGHASWQGIDLYAMYQFTDYVKGAIRGEIFNDPNGERTGVRQNWKEVTVSLESNLTKHFMLRAETRHDFSNVNAFLAKEGIGQMNNQQSYAIDAYYSFSI